MEGVCKIYEEHLKRTNPNIPSITYDISQLFDFIDQVGWLLLRVIDGWIEVWLAWHSFLLCFRKEYWTL